MALALILSVVVLLGLCPDGSFGAAPLALATPTPGTKPSLKMDRQPQSSKNFYALSVLCVGLFQEGMLPWELRWAS